MTKDPRIYIEHILESIDKMLRYTQNMEEEEFLRNELVQDAVVKNFEVWDSIITDIPKNSR